MGVIIKGNLKLINFSGVLCFCNLLEDLSGVIKDFVFFVCLLLSFKRWWSEFNLKSGLVIRRYW